MHFIDLPRDVLNIIYQLAGYGSTYMLSLTCKKLYRGSNSSLYSLYELNRERNYRLFMLLFDKTERKYTRGGFGAWRITLDAFLNNDIEIITWVISRKLQVMDKTLAVTKLIELNQLSLVEQIFPHRKSIAQPESFELNYWETLSASSLLLVALKTNNILICGWISRNLLVYHYPIKAYFRHLFSYPTLSLDQKLCVKWLLYRPQIRPIRYISYIKHKPNKALYFYVLQLIGEGLLS